MVIMKELKPDYCCPICQFRGSKFDVLLHYTQKHGLLSDTVKNECLRSYERSY